MGLSASPNCKEATARGVTVAVDIQELNSPAGPIYEFGVFIAQADGSLNQFQMAESIAEDNPAPASAGASIGSLKQQLAGAGINGDVTVLYNTVIRPKLNAALAAADPIGTTAAGNAAAAVAAFQEDPTDEAHAQAAILALFNADTLQVTGNGLVQLVAPATPLKGS